MVQHGLGRLLRRLQEIDPFNDPEKPPELRWESYMATTNDVVPKSSLPNCTKCYGCSTKLTHMASESRFFDRQGAGLSLRAHCSQLTSIFMQDVRE